MICKNCAEKSGLLLENLLSLAAENNHWKYGRKDKHRPKYSVYFLYGKG